MGPGVAPADIARLFEPFFTTRPWHGSGLSISRGLAASLGGQLELRRRKTGGTAAFIRFPKVAALVRSSWLSMEFILIVDDDPGFRSLMEAILRGEGYTVDTAGSVAEAVSIAGRMSYHLVISDLKLPDGSGVDVLRHWEQGDVRDAGDHDYGLRNGCVRSGSDENGRDGLPGKAAQQSGTSCA